MTDEVHQVLCILTSVCFGSGSIKTPKFLDDVGRLAQCVYIFFGKASTDPDQKPPKVPWMPSIPAGVREDQATVQAT
jgi:hypothetical protein